MVADLFVNSFKESLVSTVNLLAPIFAPYIINCLIGVIICFIIVKVANMFYITIGYSKKQAYKKSIHIKKLLDIYSLFFDSRNKLK